MTKYIESEAVIELFNKWADGYSYIEVPTKDAIACVRAIPAADAIEELTDRNVGKWVPVTERLPKEDGRYLVSYPLFNVKAWMRVAYFSTNLYYVDRYAFPGKGDKRPGFYYSDDEYGDVELQDITHWMPLPEPPKEG